MARSSTTLDVFNAIGEARRREILDTLIPGEKSVGAIVDDLSMSQPQVSKHLRVLNEVGLVTWRAEGRRRLYSLEPVRLQPFHDWLAKYEQAWNERLDRMDDYLKELQQGEPHELQATPCRYLKNLGVREIVTHYDWKKHCGTRLVSRSGRIALYRVPG